MDGSHQALAISRSFDQKRQDMLADWRRLIASGVSTQRLEAEIVGTTNAMSQLLKLATPAP